MTETTISQIMKYEGLDISAGVGLCEKLVALTRHLLPDITDQEVLSILQKRLVLPGIEAAMYLDEEDTAGILQSEEREVSKFKQDTDNNNNNLEPFNQSVVDFAGKIRTKPGIKPCAAKAKATRKKSSSSSSTPTVPAAGQVVISELEAHNFAPSIARVAKDLYNSRWLVTCSAGTRSRSWTLHGERRALGLVLQWAWAQHCCMTGEDCPWAWVTEIK